METQENQNEQTPEQPQHEELTTEQQIRRRTLKAFALFGAASLVPFGVWKWIQQQPKVNGLPKTFRAVLGGNEAIASLFLSHNHLAPTFPLTDAAKKVRVNGSDGMKGDFDPTTWTLKVEQTAPGEANRSFSLLLEDIKALPKAEQVIEFKCVEGWSQIQHWGGARFVDFVEKYGVGTRSGQPAQSAEDWYQYVGLETPNGGYYVGLDIESALHPQTLLAYEMNGEPLTGPHGAPLRLLIPVKYGVKNLKRIGRIFFTDQRPRDFWHERGYDYFVGL